MVIPLSDDNPTKSGGNVKYGWALWTCGNDASAPKPYLNKESLSDEGFVGSNAAV